MTDYSKRKPRTRLVHAGTHRSNWGEMSEGLFLTQGFAYPDARTAERRFAGEEEGFIYARFGNPTVAMFEERAAALEGAEDAFATASGMAAVHAALMANLVAGSRVVAARALFGSSLYILNEILPRFGVQVDFVDGADNAAWRSALARPADVVLFESIANPTLELVDLETVIPLAKAAGAKVIVDNVFATPFYLRPLEHGADLVVYSATKHMDGHGRVLGGVILGSKEEIRGPIEVWMRHTGGAISPFNAWLLLKSLESFPLRVQAATASARAAAEALDGHPSLERCLYPTLPGFPQSDLAARLLEGGGTMVTIEVKGGREAAFRMLDALEIFIISNNLGDAKSIATHPATTTHRRLSDEDKARLGITDGLIRLSFGLEDPDDLISDLTTALSRIG